MFEHLEERLEARARAGGMFSQLGERLAARTTQLAGARVVGYKSDDPIHYGTHKEPGVWDITEAEARRRGKSLEEIAKDLKSRGFVAMVRKAGQRGITSNHVHFADPDTAPKEAARLRAQRAARPVDKVDRVDGISIEELVKRGSPKPSPIEEALTAAVTPPRRKTVPEVWQEAVARKVAGLEPRPLTNDDRLRVDAVLRAYARSGARTQQDLERLIEGWDYPRKEYARAMWGELGAQATALSDAARAVDTILDVPGRIGEALGEPVRKAVEEKLSGGIGGSRLAFNKQTGRLERTPTPLLKNVAGAAGMAPYFVPGVGQALFAASVPSMVVPREEGEGKLVVPAVEMVKGAVERATHPVETWEKGEAGQLLMDVLFAGHLAGKGIGLGKAAARASVGRARLMEAYRAADAGHMDLAADKLVAALKQTPEYEGLSSKGRALAAEEIRHQVTANRDLGAGIKRWMDATGQTETLRALGPADEGVARNPLTGRVTVSSAVAEPLFKAGELTEGLGGRRSGPSGPSGQSGQAARPAVGWSELTQQHVKELDQNPALADRIAGVRREEFVASAEAQGVSPVLAGEYHDLASSLSEIHAETRAKLSSPVHEGDLVRPNGLDMELIVTDVRPGQKGPDVVMKVPGDGSMVASAEKVAANATVTPASAIESANAEVLRETTREANRPLAEVVDFYASTKNVPETNRYLRRTFKSGGKTVTRRVRANVVRLDLEEIGRRSGLGLDGFRDLASRILQSHAGEGEIVTPTGVRRIGELYDEITPYELKIVGEWLERGREPGAAEQEPAAGGPLPERPAELVNGLPPSLAGGRSGPSGQEGMPLTPGPSPSGRGEPEPAPVEMAGSAKGVAGGASELVAGFGRTGESGEVRPAPELAEAMGRAARANDALRAARAAAAKERGSVGPAHRALQDAQKRAKSANIILSLARKRAEANQAGLAGGRSGPGAEEGMTVGLGPSPSGRGGSGEQMRVAPQMDVEAILARKYNIPPAPMMPLGPRERIRTVRQIVKDMETRLGLPIRTGGFRTRTEEGQRVLGVYKPDVKVIRLGSGLDVGTLGHEIGHALEGLVFPKKVIPDQFKHDLQWLAGGTDPAEGYGEFVRLWLTNPAVAEKASPEFLNYFEGQLGQSKEMWEAMQELRSAYQRYKQLPPEQQLIEEMTIGEQQAERALGNERLYTQWINRTAGIESDEKRLAGGRRIKPSASPTAAAELARGSAGRAVTWLTHGITDRAGNVIGSSLRERLEPVKGDLNRFRAYLVARHALDVIDRLGPDSMPHPKEYYAGIVASAPAHFAGVADMITDFQNQVLLQLVGTSLTSERFNNFMAKWPHHVPLYQQDLTDPVRGDVGGIGTAFADLPDPVKPLHGQRHTLIDPLEAIVRDTFYRLAWLERNRVGQNLLRLANVVPGSGGVAEQIERPMRARLLRLEEVLGPTDLAKLEAAGVDPRQLRELWRGIETGLPQKNVVVVWDGGQRRFVQLDEDLYAAFKSLDSESANAITEILQPFTEALRRGATLTPVFTMRNPMRDFWTTMVYSKYGVTPADWFRGLKEAIWKGELYHQYRAVGGSQSIHGGLNRRFLQEALRDTLDDNRMARLRRQWESIRADVRAAREKYGSGSAGRAAGAFRGLTAAVRVLLGPLEKVSESTELASRLAEFGKGTRWGKETDLDTILEAAMASRDVTIDFQRSGTKARTWNTVIPFFNAAIQGGDKLAREMRTNPVRLMYRGAIYITAPTFALYMVNRRNGDYWDRPQYERDVFWLIPAGRHENGRTRFVKVPKPFELGYLFGTLPERILAYADKHDKEAFEKLVPTPWKPSTWGDNLMAETFAPGLLPAILTPWIQVVSNTSFMGTPIVPRREENWPAELQYGPQTSALARAIGGALDVSPRKIDALITGHTGGLGSLALQASTAAAEETGLVHTPPRPSRGLSELPVVSSFVTSAYTAPAGVGKIYDELEELSRKQKLAEAGRGEELTAREQRRMQVLKAKADALAGLSRVERLITEAETDEELDRVLKRFGIEAAGENIHERKRSAFLALANDERDIVKGEAKMRPNRQYRRTMQMTGARLERYRQARGSKRLTQDLVDSGR